MVDNIVNTVFDEFVKKGKPEIKNTKQKTTLLTVRIPEKLRDDFQDYCLRKSRRTGNKTDMSKEVIAYIYDVLECE